MVVSGVEIEPGIRVCRGASIHPRARLSAPVLVGTNAVVGRGALLASAVIGDEAIVDEASTIRQSVVTARTHVGGGLRLEDAVVTPGGVGLAQPTTWIDVRDPCLLVDALRARGEPDLAPPGLVTLGHFIPSRPQRDGRLALDRLYTEMRTRALDLRLLAAAVRSRAGVAVRVKTGSRAVVL